MKVILMLISVVLLCTCCKKSDDSIELPVYYLSKQTTIYTEADYQRLLLLTDTQNIQNIAQLQVNMNALTEILQQYKDRLGAFPTVYNEVTKEAFIFLSAYESPEKEMGQQFMLVFAKRYIRNMHAYLLGLPLEKVWQNYFHRSAFTRNTILHLAMSGINAHITYDIPYVLNEINAISGFEDDYKLYTDFIASTYPICAEKLKDIYQVKYAEDAFQLYDLGEEIDDIYGDGFTTNAIIGFLRDESWQNGFQVILHHQDLILMDRKIYNLFLEREAFIHEFDQKNLLD